MPIETFEPAQFKPYAVTTGTGKSWAKVGDNGTEFGSSLNDDLQKVSDAATGGALGSQKNFDEMMARNQGGFSSPQFQSQYQGLGGGMASSMGPESLFRAGNNRPLASFGNQVGNNMPQPSFSRAIWDGGMSNMKREDEQRRLQEASGLSPKEYMQQQIQKVRSMDDTPQMDTSFGYSEDAFQQPQMGGPQTGGPQGPSFGGGPPITPFQNTAGDVGSFNPTEAITPFDNTAGDVGSFDPNGGITPFQNTAGDVGSFDPSGGTPVDQFQNEPFDINKATDAYFQQGMNVLNPAFQQQNSNLAQSLQGSGRGGLQLASGGQGAGGGGMMNPDAYQTGNAQSNALANLYQQSRGAALGEQAQNFGQNLNTSQQQMAQMGQNFGQDASTAQLQAALQGQTFGQGLNTSQQQMSQLGQMFGQDVTGTQLGASLQGQQFGQDLSESQQMAALQGQGYGQGLGTSQQQAALQAQRYGQGLSTNQQMAALQGQQYGQNLGTEQQRMSALGQLFGQDLAAGGQRFNQDLQRFGANQGQLTNLSNINQQQMSNLGLFAGMEGDLFNQGLAAEQVRSGANAGSMYQPQQRRESTASRLGGALVGGLAGNENVFSGAQDIWGNLFGGDSGGSAYDNNGIGIPWDL